jgi:uncharacterized protein YabE (DUF348 family)
MDERARSRTVADLLRASRFEVLPLDGIEEEVLAHLPKDAKVTITASPRTGLEATLDLSERVARAGYWVLCTLDHDQWRTELRMVSTVSRPDAPVSTFASFVVEDGQPGAQQV